MGESWNYRRVVAYWHSNQKGKNNKSLSEGMANGISSAATGPTTTIANMANSVYNTAANKLQVHSPSKLFEGLGKYTVTGFVNGLYMCSDAIAQAGNNMADEAINGFNNAKSKISKVLNLDEDFNPVIKPEMDLSNIQNGFSRINDMASKRLAVQTAASFNDYKQSTRSNNENNTNTLSTEAYTKQLKQRGAVKLSDNNDINSFSAEINEIVTPLVTQISWTNHLLMHKKIKMRSQRPIAEGAEALPCLQCGALVEQDPKRKIKKFCCSACRMKWWNDHRNLSEACTVEINCKCCGKTVRVVKKSGQKYCGRECYFNDRFGKG